ncbi:MAG: branched-chain amino acid aminotransferase [Ignavibacteriae bacterium]|nr:branched-chain amino acid aminotransferase [Ignavibacteriota bacterium]
MANIKITRTQNSRISSVDWSNLGFGVYFSDHMFVAEYKNNQWNDGEILPYGPMLMEPGMCTLHYGQSIFEGLKAYKCVSGGVNIFRPDMNAKRLNHSGSRVCIPAYDIKNNIEAIIELVKIDKDWVPQKKGQSLYIRPVVFGSSNFLGVHSSSDYLLIIMTSPVSSYYPEGLNPVKIMVASEYVRTVRGGLGSSKTAANYAASLLASAKAKELGFSQVLWLDAVTRSFVDEVGAMNIMFVINDELVTPPLEQGTILAGVTRDTALVLAREWGMKVSERALGIEEIFEAHENGKLQEIFGTGTAAIISPVGLLAYKDKTIIINEQKIGPVAQKMYDTITGIQYGEIEDKHGWNIHVEV